MRTIERRIARCRTAVTALREKIPCSGNSRDPFSVKWGMSAAETLVFESVDDLPRDVAWQEFAMCKGRLELFFAKKAERPQARERREARANMLCTACPVRVPCQQFARENHEYGFWGGENEEDRHLLGYTVAAPIGIRARNA